ncbi:MAG: chemotaxis response regulator protein-glutamate methylesterase [Clostridiaceae bacterium]|nr:chemotaxis response regulator protein-glutamate methylesterase [Clostridiaceae bacterium]
MSKKIRVLIVDDSLVFRMLLSKGISADPQIEVVATAKDAFDAREKVFQYKPDVITCDVQMPKMDGIEFVRRLLPEYPIPVIVVSTISNAVFDAMSAGAVDFVVKPDFGLPRNVHDFINDMIEKIKIASCAKVVQGKINSSIKLNVEQARYDSDRIIAIGASTGGPDAISKILMEMPATSPGIVVVQHIPPLFSAIFAERLNSTTKLNAKEAQTGDLVEQGKILVAPGGKHMAIKKSGSGYKVECFDGEKVNGHRPSVDVLFESVAKEAGSKAIGVILTGMGSDGAKGLLTMKNSGAHTIGQDENTSVVYGMPRVAYEIGAVVEQLPLDKIAASLLECIK